MYLQSGCAKAVETRMTTAKGGRPKAAVPYVEWAIIVPTPLAFQVEMRLLDPVTKKSAYGARSQLIQALLFDWVEKQKSAAGSTPPEQTQVET